MMKRAWMKEFEPRWQALAARAREVEMGELPRELPLGFATRVLARAAESAAAETLDEILSSLGLRALVTACVLCAASAALAYAVVLDARLERPALEQSLAEEFPWP
jgi:hypothetical protein